MAKVRLFRGPASAHEAENEVIREFSDGEGHGGLIAFRVMSDEVGGIVVDIYHHNGVRVNVSPSEDAPAQDDAEVLGR